MIETDLYTTTEAANALKISKLTMLRYLQSGKIPAFKVGFGKRKDWRVEKRYIDEIRQGAVVL